MHNPDGSDTGREWIELYNNDSIAHNLTGSKINTDNSDHALNVPPANGGQGSMIIEPNSFAVIVQNATAFLADYSYNGTVIDSSWSDLSNSMNKTIWLKNSTQTFDNITYPVVPEGNSSCFFNSSFQACRPTPGAVNVLFVSGDSASSYPSADGSVDVAVSSGIVNATYALFGINLTGKGCTRQDNITLSYNITPGTSNSVTAEVGCNASLVSWTPGAAGGYEICGSIANLSFSDTNASNNEACKTFQVSEAVKQCNTSLSILSESIINSGSAMSYNLLLNDTACNETSVEVEYWIEDLFGSYVKAKLNTTQDFSCSKRVDRQWTPDSVAGTEAYKIKAVLRSVCDASSSDNAAEKLIVVKGGQVGSSGSSSSSSSSVASSVPVSNASVSKKNMELLSYTPVVYVGEVFETSVNISVNGTYSVYSYIYRDNTPVSEWDGKHTWDANKKELTEGGIVSLFNIIENGTTPGNYTIKIRLKAGKEEDIARQIEVLERPKLHAEKINNSVLVGACEGCELLIIGEGFEFSGANYTLEKPGVYSVLLLKDSKIFSRQRMVIQPPVANKTAITGSATAKVKAKSKVQISRNHIAMLRLLSAIKLF